MLNLSLLSRPDFRVTFQSTKCSSIGDPLPKVCVGHSYAKLKKKINLRFILPFANRNLSNIPGLYYIIFSTV